MTGTVTPWLWFDHEAEEAVRFYCSVLPDSRITDVSRYGEAGPGPEGSAMTVSFELDGRPYVALNGGPAHPFTDAFSLQVSCRDQAEVDHYWSVLSDGGEEGRCGWLTDRWGLSWQVVPVALEELLGDPDPGRAQRAMQAVLAMCKLDVETMRAAVEAG